MSLPDSACTVAYVTFIADSMPELFEKIAGWREWEDIDEECVPYIGPIEIGYDEAKGFWACFGLADCIESLPEDAYLLDL